MPRRALVELHELPDRSETAPGATPPPIVTACSSTTAGVQMGTPLFSAYIASKAALDAFTRVAASEASADGVRFTTVHMPLVRTPMIEPTKAFRNVPALRPDEAADLVLRALVTRESHIGTRLPPCSTSVTSSRRRPSSAW